VDLRPIELDVSSQESCNAAVQEIIAKTGRLDVVIHNAGHMVFDPAEAFTPEQLAELYDVNVRSGCLERLNVVFACPEVSVGALPIAGNGDQLPFDRRFARVIGNSPALEALLEQVEDVAPTDVAVLIQGETGTGKELIAHAIHTTSPRRGHAFVRVNCAAIPLDLLESELFGHEKGAFTGAIAQKTGRFELADKGTLFLDEVGDIPPALQPKLLRVLQEQEFERLGSTRTHKVDVRVVAATHRDLTDMVARGEFRSDLYYRLNVFPLLLPPLRNRREDIEPLVRHFVELSGRKIGKRIDEIPEATMLALVEYQWPGNIRELQNLIQRAVVLSKDGVLPNPLTAPTQPANAPAIPTTLRGSERALILRTLEEVGWVVGGPKGAARKLGVKRTTLNHRMRKLGISRLCVDERPGGPDPAATDLSL
jgi:transcriptional regulator with GAF, ATPase, and Fis domain